MPELINTLEAPGEFDALTTLRPGEPYFLLVGRDRLAPQWVLAWAQSNRERALKDFDAGQVSPDKRDEELRKSTQAEQIAWAMQSYKRGDEQQGRKSAKAATYSGHVLPDEVAKRDKLQQLRVRAASALNNAVAEIADLLAFIDAEFAQDAELASLANAGRETVEDMRGLSNDLTPSRATILKKRK